MAMHIFCYLLERCRKTPTQSEYAVILWLKLYEASKADNADHLYIRQIGMGLRSERYVDESYKLQVASKIIQERLLQNSSNYCM